MIAFDLLIDRKYLVPLTGFEPVTYRLGGGCSILLSYKGRLSCEGLEVSDGSAFSGLAGMGDSVSAGTRKRVL